MSTQHIYSAQITQIPPNNWITEMYLLTFEIEIVWVLDSPTLLHGDGAVLLGLDSFF